MLLLGLWNLKLCKGLPSASTVFVKIVRSKVPQSSQIILNTKWHFEPATRMQKWCRAKRGATFFYLFAGVFLYSPAGGWFLRQNQDRRAHQQTVFRQPVSVSDSYTAGRTRTSFTKALRSKRSSINYVYIGLIL